MSDKENQSAIFGPLITYPEVGEIVSKSLIMKTFGSRTDESLDKIVDFYAPEELKEDTERIAGYLEYVIDGIIKLENHANGGSGGEESK